MAENGTRDFRSTTFFRDEEDSIRRHRPDGSLKRPLTGLALSGGGIRSATFCLGVIKALHQKGKLGDFDYLSTVSGGGFAGSAVTWLTKAGTLDQFDAFLGRLRSHGNYLDPGQRLTIAALAAVVLRTVLINLLVYGGLITVGVHFALPFLMTDASGLNRALEASLLLALLFAVAAVVYALATGLTVGWVAKRRYKVRLSWQMKGGAALGLIAVAALVGLLPTLHAVLGIVLDDAFGGTQFGVLSLLGGWWAAVGKLAADGGGKAPNPLMALLMPVVALLAVVGVFVAAYDFALQLSHTGAAVLLAAALLVGWLSDLNLMSLHRMYRDRVMEAFLPNIDALTEPVWKPATEANAAMLTDFDQRPFHLLNTNVILIDSTNTLVRGRGGDSYVLTPLHSGSTSTGLFPTRDIMGRNGKDGLTLATAVAISGAAANAHIGVDAQPGILRSGAVSFLLALFGLQLGCWVSNPEKPAKTANYLIPGFNALLGKGFRTSAWFHMLSDGGHFDNTGIYELIRRQVKLIVAVDGSADGDYAYADLSAMIEKVRADFDARISFPGAAYGSLAELRPSRPCADFPGMESAARGWVEGVVHYPDGSTGRLVYIKLTLVDGLSADIYGYKAGNPSFPNQSTADQFFDEFQLESYLALGNAIGVAAADRITVADDDEVPAPVRENA